MAPPKISPKAGAGIGFAGVCVLALSPVGMAELEKREGLRLEAYADPATKGEPWTICTGATGYIHFDGKVVRVVKGLRLTLDQCRQVDHYIAETYRAALNKCIFQPLNQNQSNGIISFAVNVGTAGTCNSSVVKKINAGDFEGAAKVMLLYSCAPSTNPRYPHAHCGKKRQMPGLLDRRKYEAGLMTAPVLLFTPSTEDAMAIANAKTLKAKE